MRERGLLPSFAPFCAIMNYKSRSFLVLYIKGFLG